MKRIYLANDPISANVLKLRLEESGIQAIVQDERTFALRGKVGLTFPSVWVASEHEAEARKIALELEHPQLGTPWNCPVCGEVLEATFAECWKCAQAGEESIELTPARTKKTNWLAYSILAAVVLTVGLGVYKAYKYDEFARHYQVAVALCEENKYDAAIQEYDRSLAIDPKSYEAWTSRGYAWYSKGDFARALSDLNKSLELNPKQEHVYEYRGFAHFELGSPSKALNDYLAAAVEHPYSNDAKLAVLACKLEIGDLEGALVDAEHLRNLANFKFESALYRAYILRDLGEDARADAEIELALSLDPQKADVYLEKAQVLAGNEEFERALAECDKAQARSSEPNPHLMVTRGIILFALNRQDEMSKEMRKILELELKSRYEIPCKLFAHLLLNDKGATERDIEALLQRSPEHRWSYINAASATYWISRSLDADKQIAAIDKTFDFLDEAKKRGFKNWRAIEKNLFLKDLIAHPRFKKLAGLP